MAQKQSAGFNGGNVNITGGTINGAPVTNPPGTLFILRGANLQLTSDQVFTKFGTFTNYVVTNVISVTKTGGATVACAGGIYSAAAKAGDAIVAAAQSWVGLTGIGIAVMSLLANLIQKSETATPILSLTTGSTTAATADFFIIGQVVD